MEAVVATAQKDPSALGPFPCWALARRLYRTAGVTLPAVDHLDAFMADNPFRRASGPPVLGDLIVWTMEGVQHVAVMVGRLAAHAGVRTGVMRHPPARVLAFPGARIWRYGV